MEQEIFTCCFAFTTEVVVVVAGGDCCLAWSLQLCYGAWGACAFGDPSPLPLNHHRLLWPLYTPSPSGKQKAQWWATQGQNHSSPELLQQR